MHLGDTELEENNLSRCMLILLDLSHTNKIVSRKLHQKDITEGEKFMKIMNKPGNLCNLNLVSYALEYSF